MKISFAIASIVSLAASVTAETLLFPIPQDVEWTGHGAPLASNFKISGAKNSIVQDAAARYTRLIHKEKWVPVSPVGKKVKITSTGQLHGLSVSVADNHVKLDADVDESYDLTVPAKGGQAVLNAKTWVGALRGLETFSQLVTATGNKGALVAHTAKIHDKPVYTHRGILLDTSRNFYPLKDIFRQLDAMSYNKMNVFHWHATDSQAWPLVSETYPELSKNGAYSQKEVYRPNDVKKVIAYAKSRGIRVILEVDNPAHTATIGLSHPDVMACLFDWWGPIAAEPPAGQLNPLNKKALEITSNLLKEAAKRFPDSVLHMGGDEINGKCWETNKEIAAYLKKHNMTTDDLWHDWTNKLGAVVEKAKKRPMLWEDGVVSGGDFSKNTIIQAWNFPPHNFTSKGYDVVSSQWDYFYLDCGHGGWVGNDTRYISPTQQSTPADTFNYGGVGGSWCAPYKSWQRVYTYDPSYGVKKTDKGKVLGTEVCLWSEQSDPHTVDSKLWPRSAAAAEITWSGAYDKKGERRTLGAVQPRFQDWTLHLQARAIGAAPISPKFCTLYPGTCDLDEPTPAPVVPIPHH
ncbi:glycoside hydrolase superfamily [Gongronella butleri]|nr:glycoside hydrolase superfamily [Gongronella butleri]